MNNIERTFGPPSEILIAYGDWCRPTQMKGIVPTVGVGLRRIIQRRFEVVLIDEFRTSKLCCHCHKELTHQYVQGQQLWRALKCTGCPKIPSNEDRSLNNNRFLNRDVESAVNIMNMSKHWIQSHNRPPEFSR